MDIRKYLKPEKQDLDESEEVGEMKLEKNSPVKRSRTCKTAAAKVKSLKVKINDREDEDWIPDARDDVNVLVKVKDEPEPGVSGGLSKYELMVQKNVEERMKFLESLDIFSAKDALSELAPKPRPVKPKQKKFKSLQSSKEVAPRRQSSRLQGKLLEPIVKPVVVEEDLDHHRRPPPGPADLVEYYKLTDKEKSVKFVKGLHPKTTSAVCGKSLWNNSSERIKQILCGMSIKEDQVAKVVPQRTFSVELHPTTDTTLVLTGGKWGELGIWDTGIENEDEAIFYFNVHSRPINCLTIHNQNLQHIYTTSYDGSCRMTDLEKGTVQQVWGLEESGYNEYISWHSHSDDNTILIASSSGSVHHVDLRVDGSSAQEIEAHNQSVKVVTSHPLRSEYFATCSSNGYVCLWDMRKVKKKTPVAMLNHNRNVTGLHFSQDTGKYLVSTCSDDMLRVLESDLTNLQVKHSVPHNNWTGRWLTTFKARWLPGSDDLFVVGAMLHPRQIEVWTSEGMLLHSLQGEWLGSVCSVNAVHPMRPILAGANASGRVHIFK